MKFDPFDFVSLIVPGSLIIVAVTIAFPNPLIGGLDEVTLGKVGIALVAAFIVGHFVQALGDVIEFLYWAPFGGRPTTWVAKEKQGLLVDAQLSRLSTLIKDELKFKTLQSLEKPSAISEINAKVRSSGSADRIEKFSQSYVLLRGLTVAFLLVSVLSIVHKNANPAVAIGMIGAAMISVFRMHRFAEHYAREVYTEYLAIDRS